MSKVLGITTNALGEAAPVVLHKVESASDLPEVAEGKDLAGKVTEQTAISVTKTISYEGEIDGDVGTLAAGNTLTVGSDTYLIKSARLIEESGQYQTFSGQAELKDAATVTGIGA